MKAGVLISKSLLTWTKESEEAEPFCCVDIDCLPALIKKTFDTLEISEYQLYVGVCM